MLNLDFVLSFIVFRQLALAEEDDAMVRIAHLAQVFKQIYSTVVEFKGNSFAVCIISHLFINAQSLYIEQFKDFTYDRTLLCA